MRERPIVFLIACLLMFCVKMNGQKIPQKNFLTHSFFSHFAQNGTKTAARLFNPGIHIYPSKPEILGSNREFRQAESPVGVSRSRFLQPVPANFYSSGLGIMCRQELLFEKKTAIPLRIRLGSVDYTDYMEQKPNALHP